MANKKLEQKKSIPRDRNILLGIRREIDLRTKSSSGAEKKYSRKTKHKKENYE